jgi:hypothetical protein
VVVVMPWHLFDERLCGLQSQYANLGKEGRFVFHVVCQVSVCMRSVLYICVGVNRCGFIVSARKFLGEAKKMAKACANDATPRKSWKETVREEQQLYYEMLGDRDWDCYKKNEEKFLERNLGHAIFGPPKELPDQHKNDCTGNA